MRIFFSITGGKGKKIRYSTSPHTVGEVKLVKSGLYRLDIATAMSLSEEWSRVELHLNEREVNELIDFLRSEKERVDDQH